MIWKRSFSFLVVGSLLAVGFSAGDVAAQCSGGGGGGGMTTGSPTVLTGTNSFVSGYPSSPLIGGYPSSVGLMAQQYMQQALQMENQAYALAYQNAERQRLARLAYEERVLPMRLARAEAARQARADRTAARLAERDGDAGSSSGSHYSLTSTVAK